MLDMLELFSELERITITLEEHGLGLTFPVPGMIMKHWTPEPMSAELLATLDGYQRALDAAKQAQSKSSPKGRGYVDYWVDRLEFGIGYLETIRAVRRAAISEEAKKGTETWRQAETALATACRALESYARIACDQSDRGGIAVMNEYVYRPLKAKVEALSLSRSQTR